MLRRALQGKVPVVLLALILMTGWLVSPGTAHNSSNTRHNWRRHYAPLAKKIFFTKAGSNARFINVGEQASDADLLDGLSSVAFASASHVHSGDDITTGTVAESVIDVLIARVSDVFAIVLAADGPASGPDADLLDGQSSGAFAASSHAHSGADITSGTVAEARIDALLARDAEVFGIVTAADGSGSTLDADLLDGMSSDVFEIDGLSQEVQWFKETADSLGSTATSERVVFTAPENITITAVFVEPAAAVTASDTAYATISVSRRDATGGGKVAVASETTQTAGSGGSGSWTAYSTVSLGSLTNASLTAGQKLTIDITKTGLGVALPIMGVQIEYTVN